MFDFIPAPLWRFLRVVFAFGLAAVLDAALASLGLLELPGYAVPILAALIAAASKFLRDNYPEFPRLPV